jgi:hypothetical protein
MSEQKTPAPLVTQASGADAERERLHLMLLADVQRGLAVVEAGRTLPAADALAQQRVRRSKEHVQGSVPTHSA